MTNQPSEDITIKSPGENIKQIFDNMGVIIAIIGCAYSIYQYLAPIDFPSALTIGVKIAIIVMLSFITIAFLWCLFTKKASQILEKISIVVIAIIFALTVANNLIISSSLEIKQPNNSETFNYPIITYTLKVFNLRRYDNLQIVAQVQDPKTQLYKNYPITYLGSPNPIKGKLPEDTFLKDKELSIRFLLLAGEKTVEISDTRTFLTN